MGSVAREARWPFGIRSFIRSIVSLGMLSGGVPTVEVAVALARFMLRSSLFSHNLAGCRTRASQPTGGRKTRAGRHASPSDRAAGLRSPAVPEPPSVWRKTLPSARSRMRRSCSPSIKMYRTMARTKRGRRLSARRRGPAQKGHRGVQGGWSRVQLTYTIDKHRTFKSRKFNRGGRIRTGDLLLPKQARYRAAPRPEKVANGLRTSLIQVPAGRRGL